MSTSFSAAEPVLEVFFDDSEPARDSGILASAEPRSVNISTLEHPLAQRYDDMEFSKFLGIRFSEIGDGKVTAALCIEERHTNLMSVLHGGIVYAAADVVGYFALLSVLDNHESAATVDISVSVLRPCHVGETLVLNGRVAKRGRQVSFMETECHVDGKLVATAKVTKAMLKLPK